MKNVILLSKKPVRAFFLCKYSLFPRNMPCHFDATSMPFAFLRRKWGFLDVKLGDLNEAVYLCDIKK